LSDRGLLLLTGAAGRLGARLLPLLRERGWSVRCLVHARPVAGADELVPGDLRTGEGLDRALEGAVAVANLAAVTHARRPGAYTAVNAGGAGTLASAARRHGIARFLQVSTRAIDPAGGAYSRSKLAGERLVAASGVPFVIVRLPEVLGLGSREGVDSIVERARRNRPIPLVGDGRDELRPVPAADVSRALATALEAPAVEGRTFTLAGEPVSARAFARACVTAFDSSSRIVPVPAPVVAGLALLGHVLPVPVYPDQLKRLRSAKPPPSSGARAELGFDPPALASALAEAATREG
jgi:nucleoside-diphosphate-sugar epimerase